jgi:hypothetical protein
VNAQASSAFFAFFSAKSRADFVSPLMLAASSFVMQ